jgi:hypothetical protein
MYFCLMLYFINADGSDSEVPWAPAAASAARCTLGREGEEAAADDVRRDTLGETPLDTPCCSRRGH